MNTQEQEWVNGWEAKTEEQIRTTPLPDGSSDEESLRFRALQEEAATAARQWKGQALLRKALGELTNAAGLSSPVEAAGLAVGVPEGGAGQLAVPPEPPIPFAIPEGKTDVLLDRQIASCAGIIEHLARYIGRYDTATETCNKFMDRISAMMHSSAEAAIAVGRLRGMAEARARRW